MNSQDIKMPGNGEKPKFDKKKWRTEKYSNKVRGKHCNLQITIPDPFTTQMMSRSMGSWSN